MSKQDKATAERNARTLREMVKRPENKVCADCKRNDPRWASWNIGVFICIRCSGIHRGMGTHISKVKSVDLDMWTPEQIQSVQKWGNERANRYWEAHLKRGHVPPDHKMESFIRSKYESKRWARDGPPPADPSVLDSRDQQPVQVTAFKKEPEAPAQPAAPVQDLSNASASPPKANPPRQHTLLSTNVRSTPLQSVQPAKAAPSAPPAVPAASSARDDLFSLDFTPPSSNQPATQRPQSKDFKNDIMSLFSSSPAVPPINNLVASGTRVPQASATTSLMGQTGTAQWGVQSGWSAQLPSTAPDPWGSFSSAQPSTNAFGASVPTANPTAAAPPPNIWGSLQQPAQQPKDLFGSNVWGSSSNGVVAGETGSSTLDVLSTPAPTQQVKKDDAFGDIWGGFK